MISTPLPASPTPSWPSAVTLEPLSVTSSEPVPPAASPIPSASSPEKAEAASKLPPWLTVTSPWPKAPIAIRKPPLFTSAPAPLTFSAPVESTPAPTTISDVPAAMMPLPLASSRPPAPTFTIPSEVSVVGAVVTVVPASVMMVVPAAIVSLVSPMNRRDAASTVPPLSTVSWPSTPSFPTTISAWLVAVPLLVISADPLPPVKMTVSVAGLPAPIVRSPFPCGSRPTTSVPEFSTTKLPVPARPTPMNPLDVKFDPVSVMMMLPLPPWPPSSTDSICVLSGVPAMTLPPWLIVRLPFPRRPTSIPLPLVLSRA